MYSPRFFAVTPKLLLRSWVSLSVRDWWHPTKFSFMMNYTDRKSSDSTSPGQHMMIIIFTTCFRRWWRPFLPWHLKTYHLLIIGMSNFDHHSYDHMIRSSYRPNLQFKTTLTMTSKYFLKAYHLKIRSSFHKGNALKWPIITKYQPLTTAMYWSSTINYQLLSPYTDSLPPCTNHCCPSYTDSVHSFTS